MFRRRYSRYLAAGALGIITAGVLFALFAPSNTPGYDTSFTLAWGRDLAHGLPLDFGHPSSPTPHPLALLAGLGAGFLPVNWGVNAAVGVGAAAGITTLALLGLVAFEVAASRIAVVSAVATAAVSAPLGLLVLGASSDVGYAAIGLGAVLLTLRARYVWGVAAFMVAALLRPEAALLGVVPLALALLAGRAAGSRPSWARVVQTRATWVFAGGLIAAVATWLATGAAGGDPLIALHSASTNAQVNDDPRGPAVALTHALPGLAGPTGWLTVWAAAIALVASVALARRARRHVAATRTAATRKAAMRKAAARTAAATTNPQSSTPNATMITGIFVGVGLIAYLAQGLTGTPLVARYLLLPALLCVTVAARCAPLAGKLARNAGASRVTATAVGVVLVAASVASNISGWKDVTNARDLSTDAFVAATALLDTDLARDCDAPVVVRSPAMVAMTALTMDRPLRDIEVSDQAGKGVLLQPLTNDAATLAGYGPMTPLDQQGIFPADAPPRQSNAYWALYSSCQP